MTPASTVVLEFPGSGTAGRVRTMGLEQLGVRPRYLFDEVRPRVTGIEEYARQLFARVATDGVDVVVAYCGATAIARHLAEHSRREHGRRPPLVAVNPELTEAAGVARLLGRTVDRITVTDTGDRRPFDADAGTVRDVVARRLPDLESALARSYAEPPLALGAAAAQLAGVQADWLAHVTAACDPAAFPPAPDETHLVARDHRCAPDCPARHDVIDVAQQDFFTHADTRRTLLGLVCA